MLDQNTKATSRTPAVAPPALWNPNAAACWSLVFSPAFGAFLHARNADTLGLTKEAKANRVWFKITVAFLVLTLISVFIPAIPDAIFNVAAIGLLLGWYFSQGKKQIKYVKDTWQDRYQRKSWTKPLLIAFGWWLGVIAVFISLAIIGALLEESPKDEITPGTNVNAVLQQLKEMHPDQSSNFDVIFQGLKGSALAKKLLSLDAGNAYLAGQTDGLQDAKDTIVFDLTNQMSANINIYDFIDMKSNIIILLGAAQPRIDTDVLSNYQHGWIDGANSVITRQAWKARLSQINESFRATGTKLAMNMADFVKFMGKPDRTETVDNSTYWYYDCSDGTIQIELNSIALNAAGIMQGNVNDY
jgi:hypothetical protein